jgi:hypothetical protein
MTTLTETLSKFIADTGFDALPPAVVGRAKHHILDGIGVMLAGSRHQISRKALRYVELLGGKPQATVIGSGIKIAAGQAAFVNATMGHVLDFDDDIVTDQQNRKLMQRVKLRVESAMDEPGNSLGAQISVQCASGQTYEHIIVKALGGLSMKETLSMARP